MVIEKMAAFSSGKTAAMETWTTRPEKTSPEAERNVEGQRADGDFDAIARVCAREGEG